MRQTPKIQLFLTSFAILYLELALIRFIPAYVRYLGYFTNFILLAAFLGIGVGCLLMRSRRDLLPLFSPLFLLLVLLIKYYKFEVQITTSQIVFFTSNSEKGAVESFFLIPGIFLVITLLFTTLAQKLGRLLTKFAPLTAYTIDILGSIAGIILFTAGSFLRINAWWWFVIFDLCFLLLLPKAKKLLWLSVISLGVSLALLLTLDDLPTYWSPYQKVSPYSVSNPLREKEKPDIHWRLYVNNISHQEMTPYSDVAEFYKLHYQIFPRGAFDQALIVGSGSGQDVNVALKQNVSAIDAVEIDPVIADLGKKLHPDAPYADPRVHLIINDARSYLENTRKKYDLIIFALPDSAILSTQLSSLRLESYLFTLEAFRQVKNHLAEDGVFVLYNFYREPWLVDKIAVMLKETFASPPLVVQHADNLAVFLAGSKLDSIQNPTPFKIWQGKSVRAATDDWPFLYLKDLTLPKIYLKSLALILLIAISLIFIVTRGQILHHFSGDFFFLGAAFLLIETKSIVNFNLLFGSTWLVNSLVFVGILVSVLVAIWVNHRWRITNLYPWALFLILVLIANYLLPIERFLLPNFWLRYIGASIFFFSPIFLGNVIFSNLFKRAGDVADNFGINLIGAFFGGTFEYASLLWGYHNLILVALLFYLLAFMFVRRRLKSVAV